MKDELGILGKPSGFSGERETPPLVLLGSPLFCFSYSFRMNVLSAWECSKEARWGGGEGVHTKKIRRESKDNPWDHTILPLVPQVDLSPPLTGEQWSGRGIKGMDLSTELEGDTGVKFDWKGS